MIAEGPPGTDHFVAMVSRYPRAFIPAGAADPRQADPPPQAGPEPDSAWPPQAGRAACPRAQPRCSAAYGAARFTIEEVGPARAAPAS